MSQERFGECRIHGTALIEDGVTLGVGTSVWDSVHIRHGARIGRHCILGEKTYVAYDVRIGDYCKLNANVYVCAGVTIDDFVMISAHTVFTNDVFPRAFDRTLDGLAGSDPTEETLLCHVRRGVTIGANATIGPGITLGEFSMIGMGSVVTRDVPSHALVIGNPARLVAMVCACGPVFAREPAWSDAPEGEVFGCSRCGRVYRKAEDGPREVRGPSEVTPESATPKP